MISVLWLTVMNGAPHFMFPEIKSQKKQNKTKQKPAAFMMRTRHTEIELSCGK